jgi:hypothetical protein
MIAAIAEQARQLAEPTATQPPNEVVGAFAEKQADLAATRTPTGVIGTGSTLPDADQLTLPPR